MSVKIRKIVSRIWQSFLRRLAAQIKYTYASIAVVFTLQQLCSFSSKYETKVIKKTKVHLLRNLKKWRRIFLQANWYKAEQYCRFHGMHLASINTADQQKDLEEHIESFGKKEQRRLSKT